MVAGLLLHAVFKVATLPLERAAFLFFAGNVVNSINEVKIRTEIQQKPQDKMRILSYDTKRISSRV
jgi:hypothetical protein